MGECRVSLVWSEKWGLSGGNEPRGKTILFNKRDTTLQKFKLL